jgi:hypothetical protein
MPAGSHPLIHVGFLAFFVVALVVGVRLILLWVRTRQLPELLIGLGVLGIGPVGFGCAVAALSLRESQPALYSLAMGVASAAIMVGVVSKLVFNWRVYHPESGAVRAVVVLGAAIMLGCWLYDWRDGFDGYRELNVRFALRTPIQLAALLWGSAEALRWYARMRKRAALGLGDAVVANRFLLWAIGAGSAGLGSLIGVAVQVATGTVGTQIPWVLASSSAHGFVAAVAMWLAFVPPAGYVRWIQARAAA